MEMLKKWNSISRQVTISLDRRESHRESKQIKESDHLSNILKSTKSFEKRNISSNGSPAVIQRKPVPPSSSSQPQQPSFTSNNQQAAGPLVTTTPRSSNSQKFIDSKAFPAGVSLISLEEAQQRQREGTLYNPRSSVQSNVSITALPPISPYRLTNSMKPIKLTANPKYQLQPTSLLPTPRSQLSAPDSAVPIESRMQSMQDEVPVGMSLSDYLAEDAIAKQISSESHKRVDEDRAWWNLDQVISIQTYLKQATEQPNSQYPHTRYRVDDPLRQRDEHWLPERQELIPQPLCVRSDNGVISDVDEANQVCEEAPSGLRASHLVPEYDSNRNDSTMEELINETNTVQALFLSLAGASGDINKAD